MYQRIENHYSKDKFDNKNKLDILGRWNRVNKGKEIRNSLTFSGKHLIKTYFLCEWENYKLINE